MSEEDQKELERLRAENEALKAQQNKALQLKVSQKGAVSVYGLGRFPVTLYQGQWQKLLEIKTEILKFIDDNSKDLATKD